MGTETTAMTTWQNALPTLWVKLNNPLMGTETYLHRVYKLSHCQILVKLNNPLMGTETHFLNFCFYELKY